MASTLCVKARRDIRVVPGIVDHLSEELEAEPSPQVVELVTLMRATSLDAAENTMSTDIELASTTVYVARALKLKGVAKTTSAEHTTFAGTQTQYGIATSPAQSPNEESVVGLITLHSTLSADDLNLSVAVLPPFESDGIATHLVSHVLEVAFQRLNSHRVQARVVHSSAHPAQTARAVGIFIHLGFVHEGVRRRAALHPTEGRWSDVTVLALSDLDWFSRTRVAALKGTLWDEMFARHQRDREILLRMEGSIGLKGTPSIETTRDLWSRKTDTVRSAIPAWPSSGYSSVTSGSISQISVPTVMSSWDGVSDSVSARTHEAGASNIMTMSPEDDTSDDDDEWNFDEYYSDDEDNKV